MDELKELCSSVKKFDKVINDLSNYVLSDEDPPNSQLTVQKTRDEVHIALNDLTTQHSVIEPCISSASKTMKINKQLLEKIEATVKKRETYLSKYGFKPSEVELPVFPSKSHVQPDSPPKSKPNIQGVLLKAQTPHKTPNLTSSEALIAKYTPAKNKVSPGEETYVIRQYSDLASSRGFEDRMAQYSIAPNQFPRSKVDQPVVDSRSSADMIGKYANSTAIFAKPQSSTASEGFDERMSRYSIAPDSMTNKNKRLPGEIEIDPTKENDAEPKVRKIGDLLSKYSRPKSALDEVENVIPAATSESKLSTFKTPTSIQHLMMNSNALEDSFPIGFTVNKGKENTGLHEEYGDLEQTVNLGNLNRPDKSKRKLFSPAVNRDDLDGTINPANLPNIKQPSISSIVNKNDFITPKRPCPAQPVSKTVQLISQALSFEESESTKTSKQIMAPEIVEKIPGVQNSTNNDKLVTPALSTSSIMAKYSQKYNVK